jgi:hypothetical protein
MVLSGPFVVFALFTRVAALVTPPLQTSGGEMMEIYRTFLMLERCSCNFDRGSAHSGN